MTSKGAKKNLKQNKRIPRISTRGFYDLSSGKTIKKKPYDLYPKKFFEKLGEAPEFTIMIHGLRNNKKDALKKFRIAQTRLRQLGYRHHVVGFSYDSNVWGVQYKSHVHHAMAVGRFIAKKNGRNLAKFILDSKKKSPNTKIRLIGHSLGSEVITHTIFNLRNKKNMIEDVCFFGSSIPANSISSQKFARILRTVVRKKLLNHYNPNYEVLRSAVYYKIIENPISCYGIGTKRIPKYAQKQVKSKDHSFASYAAKMTSF